MPYPILGTPKPAFFDSSGAPLASGTLSVLEPSDDTNKASYPTYDDAVALTNANTNPITLDSRGETTNEFWGLDGEDYKLVLKGSDGNNVWTVDPAVVPQDPGIYNVKSYGATGDGSTDDATSIQAALDAANTAGGGVVLVPEGTYKVNTGLTVYGGTILRGTGRGQRFSTFSSETGTIIIAGASIVLVTTTANAAGAGGAVIEDLLLDGANLATTVLSMQGIRDACRNTTITRGTTYGVVNNVTGVAEQLMSNVIITMDSQGTAGWYVQSGSDSNYHNVIVHGCAVGILIESGGHQFSHIHPYPSPISPTVTDWLVDINNTGDNFFVNCHFDQVHKADRAQVRIRTGSGADESALDNAFIGCSFDNPSMTAVDVVAVYMDASLGSNNWITASFVNCSLSGNGTNKYTYAFEKEATNPGRIIYNVIGGIYNNVTTLWSHAPDHTFGVQHVSGGITEVGSGGVLSRGLWATKSGGELTIASGAITITDSHHRVDTESDAASDDLDTVTGGIDGEILVLQAQDSTRAVVLKDGTGNLALNDDFSLLSDQASITLQYHFAQSEWVELSRTPGVANVDYTPTNVATVRTFDANDAAGAISASPTQAEVENIRDAALVLSDVVGTLIADLQARGVIG